MWLEASILSYFSQAISAIMHEFVDEPVTCMVNSLTVKHGKSNCLWSSCREGCTADIFQCYQVNFNLAINVFF